MRPGRKKLFVEDGALFVGDMSETLLKMLMFKHVLGYVLLQQRTEVVTGDVKARVRGYTCFLSSSLFQPATAASARERLVHHYTTGYVAGC